jgi:hypothetical protein
MVDQREGMATAQLAERPVLEEDALDLYIGDPTDSVVVRCVGPLGARVALSPSGGVIAEGVRAVREAVSLVNGFLRIALSLEGALASVPARLRDVPPTVPARVAGHPNDLPGGVAALDWRLPPHDA